VDGKTIAVWWLDYSTDGKRHRESSKSTSQRVALDLLRQRIGDRKTGKLVGRPDRVTVGELEALALKQYDLDGRRSKARVTQCWAHVVAFFGAEARVSTVSGVRLDDYAAARLAAGAARQTVNNELSALRRGFRLAINKGLLAVMPAFTLPKVHNARSGFLEDGDFAALLLELPADVRDLVQFLRATGWRRDEGRLLTWAAVDREAGTIRLEDARSKSGKPRVFPFGLAPELVTLLERRYDARDGLYVFHRAGQPLGIGAVRSAWKRATTRAGVAGRLVHDLRRSAAREFRKAGVSEGVVMRLCGWETRSMFDRYNIIDAADLDAAVAKRFGSGTVAAQSETPVPSPDSLTSHPHTS
jgi:integrase